MIIRWYLSLHDFHMCAQFNDGRNFLEHLKHLNTKIQKAASSIAITDKNNKSDKSYIPGTQVRCQIKLGLIEIISQMNQ